MYFYLFKFNKYESEKERFCSHNSNREKQENKPLIFSIFVF